MLAAGQLLSYGFFLLATGGARRGKFHRLSSLLHV